MATATIVKLFAQNGKLCMVVSVNEGGAIGVRQYVGKVPLSELDGKTNAEKKAMMVAACKATRDALIGDYVTVPSISGTVDV